MAICDRDCGKCSRLNIKVDKLGYPWGYECLKYGDSVEYYGSNVPLFRRNGYRQSGVMIP